MRLFKSKERRIADLQARVERMGRIMCLAGAAAMETDETIGPMLPTVMEELRELDKLPLRLRERFMDLLESGIPEELAHVK